MVNIGIRNDEKMVIRKEEEMKEIEVRKEEEIDILRNRSGEEKKDGMEIGIIEKRIERLIVEIEEVENE